MIRIQDITKILLGNSSTGDVMTSVAGYISASMVAYLSFRFPNIGPDTTVAQLAGMTTSAMLAVIGRLALSGR